MPFPRTHYSLSQIFVKKVEKLLVILDICNTQLTLICKSKVTLKYRKKIKKKKKSKNLKCKKKKEKIEIEIKKEKKKYESQKL